jgi:3-oxoacyl-[acyl-carrier-protein] synthase-3
MGVLLNHIATYLPEAVLTNDDLASQFNTSGEQIFKNTGITKRFLSAEGEMPSDLAVKAGEILLQSYNIDLDSVDFLIFCSEGFDHKGPSSSCLMQHRLGLGTHIGCIDLPYGCSGYIYGLGIAHGLMEGGIAKTILFLTSDNPTKVCHKDDLELRSIFSDIGTATLLTKSKSKQLFIYGTDGNGYNNLIVDQSGTRNPPTVEYLNRTNLPFGHMKMNSTEIFLFAVRTVPKLVTDILEKYEYKLEDIDLFVFHQASAFMLEVIRKKCKIPKEKFFVNIENFGNSVSSTIPTALNDAEQQGILKKGMKVMLAGFGIGYSWGATIIEY